MSSAYIRGIGTQTFTHSFKIQFMATNHNINGTETPKLTTLSVDSYMRLAMMYGKAYESVCLKKSKENCFLLFKRQR